MKNYYNVDITYDGNCTEITLPEWEERMQGAVKANGSKIRRLIKQQHPDLYQKLGLEFPNPYEHQAVRTKRHLIYVHSAIEFFFTFN